MKVLSGKSVCDEIGVGKLWVYKREQSSEGCECADNSQMELMRYEEALQGADKQLQGLYEQCVAKLGEKEAAVFEGQRLLLGDEGFTKQVRALINERAVSAEWAVRHAGEEIARKLREIPDPYIQQRAQDVQDVTKRLEQILRQGEEGAEFQKEAKLPDEPFILVAEDLLPSEMVRFVGTTMQGIVLAGGSAESHVSIFAKSMGLPLLIGVGKELLEVSEGQAAVLDGSGKKLFIEPDEELCAEIEKKREQRRQEKDRLRELIGLDNVTGDGRNIKVYANVGTLAEVELACENDAGGIGLLRSEMMYLERECEPGEEEQFEFYKRVLERMGDKEVIIRTLDIGADKQVPFWKMEKEENPALGLRAIRMGLMYPEMLKTQLRALYRAGVYGNLRIMYPMITSVKEVQRLKALEEEVKEELRAKKQVFAEKLPTGIMIETPAAAILSGELAREVDFFSVGSNDLTQYTLALDRRNEKLAQFQDPQCRAVLQLIEMAAKSAHEAGIPIGICGELAADTGFTSRFLEMGIDELSVAPSEILKVRKQIKEI